MVRFKRVVCRTFACPTVPFAMPSPASPPKAPPRKNWFVALTVGILRGIGSLFATIAKWLEANPSDPRPSLGLWGVAIGLAVAVTVGLGKVPTVERLAIGDLASQIADPTAEQPVEPGVSESSTGQAQLDAPDLETTQPESALAEPSPIASARPGSDAELQIEPETVEDLAEEALEPSSAEPTELPPTLPEELIAPTSAAQLEPAPPPLTPEQHLIAALQERIAAVSEEYAQDEIISTVRVDFARNRLEVELTDDWYGLDVAAQEQLASDLCDRGRTFDFYDLDIVDGAGELLARPASIGDATIVVRHSRD